MKEKRENRKAGGLQQLRLLPYILIFLVDYSEESLYCHLSLLQHIVYQCSCELCFNRDSPSSVRNTKATNNCKSTVVYVNGLFSLLHGLLTDVLYFVLQQSRSGKFSLRKSVP